MATTTARPTTSRKSGRTVAPRLAPPPSPQHGAPGLEHGYGDKQLTAARRLALLARYHSQLEWLLLGLATPTLLFPGRLTPLGLVLIACTWLIRRAATGRWSVPSAADKPLAVLLLTLVVSLVPSIRLDYSLPKLWGIVLGVALFSTCLNTCRTAAEIRRAGLALLGLGTLLTLGGVLYMAEPPSKLFGSDVYRLLPSFDRRIQSSTITVAGVSPNEVGAVAALFAPLALALLGERGRLRLAALFAAVLLLGSLVLTQSRSGLVGVAAALLVGALWRAGKWVALAIAVLALGAGGAAVGLVGLPRLSELASNPTIQGLLSPFGGRLELWQRALAMLADMPFTGVGLNTFPAVVQSYYPGFVSAEYYETALLIPHAHNSLLQTSVDLGLIGLFAFSAIVLLAVRGGLVAMQRGVQRPIATGLLLGLLAHGVFGLTDALALGAKPGATLWLILGLLLALGQVSHPAAINPRPASGRLTWLWRGAAAGAAVLLICPFVVAPVGLNGALLLLHHADGWRGAESRVVDEALAYAERWTWGPYPARTWAARAVEARVAGDLDGELFALEEAIYLGAWDPSLVELRSEVKLLQEEPVQLQESLGKGRLLETLLRRARGAPPTAAVGLLRQAQALEPGDGRAYLAAADILWRSGQSSEAAKTLAGAVQARGKDPWHTALSRRLFDSRTELPLLPALRSPELILYPSGGPVYHFASMILAERQDRAGANYADQLEARSYVPRAAD